MISEVAVSKPYGRSSVLRDREGNIKYDGNGLMTVGYTSLQLYAGAADFPRNSTAGPRLSLAEGLEGAGITWSVYDGTYGTPDPNTRVPDDAFDATSFLEQGLELNIYADDEEWFAWWSDLTVAVTRGGVTQLFPFNYCFIYPDASTLYPNLYANASGSSAVARLMDKTGLDGDVEVYSYTLPAASDYVPNAVYWLRLRLAKAGDSSGKNNTVKAAYVGRYDSMVYVEAANAEDIKDELFAAPGQAVSGDLQTSEKAR